MSVANVAKLNQTSLNVPIKGPSGKPLTTTDDIAVEVLVSSRGSYQGFKSLSDVLTDLIQVVKGPEQEDVTEAIDSLQEVYNFLTEYKNTETLKEVFTDIEEVSKEDVAGLFPEFNETTPDKEKDSTNTEDNPDINN